MNFDFNYILLPVTLACLVAWLVQRRRRKHNPDTPKKGLVYLGADIFPILFLVFVFRSFIIEPYQIPSGSMIPSLRVGDFILVNKFAYGVRLPISNNKIIPVGEPERGDILVFQFPEDPEIRYIKRVIGTPGDIVELSPTYLTVNGVEHSLQPLELDYEIPQTRSLEFFTESNGATQYKVARDLARLAFAGGVEGRWEIPEDHYFVLGDNRENSNDSRYWGLVPEANVIGEAFFIWLHVQSLSKINFSNFGSID